MVEPFLAALKSFVLNKIGFQKIRFKSFFEIGYRTVQNVLVFPCGTEIGMEIFHSLAFSKHFRLFGGNSIEDHGKFLFREYIGNIPFVDNKNFLNRINDVVKKNKIDFIFPAHDSAIYKMAFRQEDLLATLITSPFATCKVCRQKELTYRYFHDKLPTPEVFSREDKKIKFPVFLKPKIGQGSKGTFKVHSRPELLFYLKKDPSLLILEFLPGKEFTIDCFSDKSREILFIGGRERKRVSNGISVSSFPVFDSRFIKMANIINKHLEFRGVWFFQVKENRYGELALLEIAPRVAGTMGLCRSLGVNLPELSLFDRMGLDVKIIKNQFFVKVDRALFSRFESKLKYKIVFVDFDDTIVSNNFVNTHVIKFLYQCKNLNKKIYLISKHKGNIKAEFSKYAISEKLFDKILILRPDEQKSKYITEKKSIFIDDSFSERLEVFSKCKVPVFGVESVESLLNWKL